RQVDRSILREVFVQNIPFDLRKSHRVAIHGIADRVSNMGKISALSNQLLNDAIGVFLWPAARSSISCGRQAML
ncbi:hypothetical protein QNL22_28025, partial [Pseudomonas syringae pv. tomato]|nr:hypothetical protein [Pseudomonas syringae pv. tomato]